ncbi:efflux RND transporter periplasmic adaptor subunit [Gemmobacter sp.]|uniref:efflux RND transporter periplasmic adaptor subunit n=1 Tax=Gemmobacter sp. TaxID=1898957 RepID=UPI002B002D75|nr:efflux RND transporter periplasmic adaptor subunit [Gemmobacter sp.]
MSRLLCAFACTLALTGAATANPLTLAPIPVTDWKAVHARIEAKDRLPARARIGGTLTDLLVAEGDSVARGQPLARVTDDKLGFQLAALHAQRDAIAAQLANARAELHRGEELLKQGVTTAQRLDALRTQVDVLAGQLTAVNAQAEVVVQTQAEGLVLAPADGRVLTVPVAAGAVVMAGETIATVSGGGIFLRLALPERHAASLSEGDPIRLDDGSEGRLIRLYPLIENGRVIADVEVPGLSDRFEEARVLVRLPVAERQALMVPAGVITTRGGLDFVAVETPAGPVLRAVVPGLRQTAADGGMVEILSGLTAGDVILPASPAAAKGASHD